MFFNMFGGSNIYMQIQYGSKVKEKYASPRKGYHTNNPKGFFKVYLISPYTYRSY